jgi:hypothetical protein
MRFKMGFVTGCAVGAWTAAKAAQLRRLGVQPDDHRWPRVVGSRAGAVNAEVTAEKLRALGDLARVRVGSLVGERPTPNYDRIVSLLGASLRDGSAKAISRWPGGERSHSA